MQTKEGRDLWKEYGSRVWGEFDTSPGSYSMTMLEAYIGRVWDDISKAVPPIKRLTPIPWKVVPVKE